MKIRIDWLEYSDCKGPQEVRTLDGSIITPKNLIGMRIVGVVEDDFFGLILEVEI